MMQSGERGSLAVWQQNHRSTGDARRERTVLNVDEFGPYIERCLRTPLERVLMSFSGSTATQSHARSVTRPVPTVRDFVQLRDVYKSYGEKLVVMDKLNLSMRADDRLVIIGPSGSGKSSLLRVMMGLEGIQG
ncbi:ATP-binding cassette domain-containing protein, partial [Pandoraea terrae]|uniref:ATP-binding cassette domain-containing protein n=1 Tax=Pandoraea terrae TaxID=1537710 RepID=UPI001CD47F5F